MLSLIALSFDFLIFCFLVLFEYCLRKNFSITSNLNLRNMKDEFYVHRAKVGGVDANQ